MNTLNKIVRLADRFERKLFKYAGEVDSSLTTPTVRASCNPIISSDGQKVIDSVKKFIEKKGYTYDKLFLGKEVSVSAVKSGGKWEVTKFTIKGEVAGDFTENDSSVKDFFEKSRDALINKKLIPVVQSEFNRMSKSFGEENSTITDL